MGMDSGTPSPCGLGSYTHELTVHKCRRFDSNPTDTSPELVVISNAPKIRRPNKQLLLNLYFLIARTVVDSKT